MAIRLFKFSYVHVLILAGIILVIVLLNRQVTVLNGTEKDDEFAGHRHLKSNYNYEMDGMIPKSSRYINFNGNIPLIWVGGVPRSGTTLIRAMLDAHPEIRCGEETRVIPRVLALHQKMDASRLEKSRLKEAKITDEILNDALGAYILTVILKHGEPALRYCNKDPFALRSTERLKKIFPNSKFILMIRDGRATANSIVSRHVTIKGFDSKTYEGALKDWNRSIKTMYAQCQNLPHNCMPVYYEQLVLHPEKQMRKILNFLEIGWASNVLHHEDAIGKAGGISLSRRELSTDQVNKPINTGALTAWVKNFPVQLRDKVDELAPMLETLGYDTDTYPPFYGTPDEVVAKQSKMLQFNATKRYY